MAANLQYNVYRFFEYWQQGIDEIMGSDDDNSDVPVPCPFYRDFDIELYDGKSYVMVGGYGYNPRCYARCTIDNSRLSFIHDLHPIDYYPDNRWDDTAIQNSYDMMVSKVNEYNFVFGMDENHVGEYITSDLTGAYQYLKSEHSNYPFEIDQNQNKYYGTIAIVYDGDRLNIGGRYSNPFHIATFGAKISSDSVGVNVSPREISSITNIYHEYNNHYTENDITVYYSDDFTYITYEGDKTYNQVQNVVNNAYNNDNSVTIKVNAPSYETVKNGDRHPYFIAPIQPLQIPELGEMSLPSGDFGDSPKILAESVNEMTGLLDHLGLTSIFIICALLVFIIRKVRD